MRRFKRKPLCRWRTTKPSHLFPTHHNLTRRRLKECLATMGLMETQGWERIQFSRSPTILFKTITTVIQTLTESHPSGLAVSRDEKLCDGIVVLNKRTFNLMLISGTLCDVESVSLVKCRILSGVITETLALSYMHVDLSLCSTNRGQRFFTVIAGCPGRWYASLSPCEQTKQAAGQVYYLLPPRREPSGTCYKDCLLIIVKEIVHPKIKMG